MARKPMALDQGFWEHVAPPNSAGCRLWSRGGSMGYGTITRRAWSPSPIRVHRVAYFLTHGTWPPVVMHTCDVPLCCEPTHLVAGTRKANNQDRAAKGRTARTGRGSKWCSIHPRIPANMKPNGPGKWTCRTCVQVRQRATG